MLLRKPLARDDSVVRNPRVAEWGAPGRLRAQYVGRMRLAAHLAAPEPADGPVEGLECSVWSLAGLAGAVSTHAPTLVLARTLRPTASAPNEALACIFLSTCWALGKPPTGPV